MARSFTMVSDIIPFIEHSDDMEWGLKLEDVPGSISRDESDYLAIA